MIRITKGTAGYWNGHSVVPKSAKDGPLDCFPPEVEEKLVRRGVAAYVVPPAGPASEPARAVVPPPVVGQPAPVAAPKAVAAPGSTGTAKLSMSVQQQHETVLPAYDVGMKLADLKEIAMAYGVDASGCWKKSDVVALIDAAREEGDDEPPPLLAAADPV